MKFAAGIEYRGTDFFGWQRQAHTENTIQFHVEKAISSVANEPIEIACAGRTDSGVHATGQVIHFTSSADRSMDNWRMGINTNLPKSIRISWIRPVSNDFHARFSAKFRRYHYLIMEQSNGSAIFDGLITTVPQKLDVDAMAQAAKWLIGEHDFSSFRGANCQSKSAFRCVHAIQVYRKANSIVVDIQADAFLYHMVRNIVGSVLYVGQHKRSLPWFRDIFFAKDRTLAAPTAPANGLYLVAVGYDLRYNVQLMNNRLLKTPWLIG